MQKHPTARRVHRDTTEPDDLFVANVLEASAWAQRNTRALIIAGAVLAVAVLSGLYYMNYRSQMRVQASTRLNEIRQSMNSANPALTTKDLEAFIDRFGGTPAGGEAKLTLGQVYLQTGKQKEAIELLNDLAADPKDPAGPSAALLLAAAYEQNKELDKAEQAYLKLAEDAPLSFQKRDALDRAAILRMERGNAAGAAELYRQILKDAPEELPQRALYEVRLGEAEAAAAGAKG
jgi:predicted negative regulator of RcsB-dependent stress response